MKFHMAWADIASQNVSLKLGLGALALSCAILSFTSVKLALKPPLLIDRECYTSVISPQGSKHTKDEIKAFVQLALEQRFNSSSQVTSLLSQKELRYRADEQQKLKATNMRQTIVTSDFEVTGNSVKVNADRLISVGEIRSAFQFALDVEVSSTGRSQSNPYGLILEKALPIKKEEKKQ